MDNYKYDKVYDGTQVYWDEYKQHVYICRNKSFVSFAVDEETNDSLKEGIEDELRDVYFDDEHVIEFRDISKNRSLVYSRKFDSVDDAVKQICDIIDDAAATLRWDNLVKKGKE